MPNAVTGTGLLEWGSFLTPFMPGGPGPSNSSHNIDCDVQTLTSTAHNVDCVVQTSSDVTHNIDALISVTVVPDISVSHDIDSYVLVNIPPVVSTLACEYEGFRIKLFDFGDGTTALTVHVI